MVWNTAFVPSTIAKYIRMEGHEVFHVHRIGNTIDEMLHAGLNEPIEYWLDMKEFRDRVLELAPNYDLVHLHSAGPAVKEIRDEGIDTPIVLTYHGTDIRGNWINHPYEYWKQANVVTVATEDLLKGAPEYVKYIPNVVDTHHFRRENDYHEGSALFVWINAYQKTYYEAMRISKMQNWSPTIHIYPAVVIPYHVYPRFLEVFEFLLDVNEAGGKLYFTMSFTSLQQLALGGKVFFNTRTYDELPYDHTPEDVIPKWINVYETCLEGESLD